MKSVQLFSSCNKRTEGQIVRHFGRYACWSILTCELASLIRLLNKLGLLCTDIQFLNLGVLLKKISSIRKAQHFGAFELRFVQWKRNKTFCIFATLFHKRLDFRKKKKIIKYKFCVFISSRTSV